MDRMVRRLARLAVGGSTAAGNEVERVQGRQRQEGQDEPRHDAMQGDAAGFRAVACRRGGSGFVGLFPEPARQHRQHQDHRAEHQHANELDQGPDLNGREPDRRRRRDDLRHGIDREARQHAELGMAEGEDRRQQGQAQHHEDAENGRERDRGRDVVAIGPDHRRHRRDGRVAADGIAAGHQDRHAARQAERPADQEARRDHDRHDRGDAEQQPRPDGRQSAEADRRPEQHDGHFEQDLGAELDAAVPPLAPVSKASGPPSRSGSPSPGLRARPGRIQRRSPASIAVGGQP